MSFWTESNITPKRNFRFLVQIDGITTNAGAAVKDSLLWYAKTAQLPSFEMAETEHNFLDNKFYFPGRVSWSEVAVSLVDPVSPDATAIFSRLMMKQGYVIKDASMGTAPTISKRKAVSGGVANVSITVIDDEGTEIEKWVLKNPFIKSVSFSDLDYSSDDLKQIDVTFRYDWAECVTKAGQNTDGTYFKKATTDLS